MAVVGFLSVVASGKITVSEAESIGGAGRQIPQDDKWGTWISEARTGASGTGAIAGGGQDQERPTKGRFRKSLQVRFLGRGAYVWTLVSGAPKFGLRLSRRMEENSTAGRRCWRDESPGRIGLLTREGITNRLSAGWRRRFTSRRRRGVRRRRKGRKNGNGFRSSCGEKGKGRGGTRNWCEQKSGKRNLPWGNGEVAD